MPRFAILRHDSPQGLHWDFLLEAGQELRTWALPQPPEPGVELTAEELPRHRPAYLDYEGPVSGGRGSVTRWDVGTYRLLSEDNVRLEVELTGERLTARAVLRRSDDNPQQWHVSLAAQ